MRYGAVLLGAILVVFALNVHAQVNPNYLLPQVSAADGSASPATDQASAPLLALATMPELDAADASRDAAPSPTASGESAAQPQEPPTVHGVFQQYNWQFYAGYSFFRFYVVSRPNTIITMNGLDFGNIYYVPKFSWLGVEGQFIGEYGGYLGYTGKFAVGMGGLKYRWSAPRAVVLWAHGLVGGTKFVPRTAYGNESAFAYEAGAGVDVGPHDRRLGYRLELDMVGTRYFSTYQYSPRIAIGIVFKY